MSKLSSNKFGLIGGLSAVVFFLTFLILGFIQPNYNHFRDPISVLVSGKFGWIQEINLMVFMISLISIVLGLLKSVVKTRFELIRNIFIICVVDVFVVLLFPAVRPAGAGKLSLSSLPLEGKIHYYSVWALMLLIAVLLYLLVQELKNNSRWKKVVPYSYFNLIFNLIFGTAWFTLSDSVFLLPWMGLLQKLVVTNFLMWLGVVGYKLWRFEE